MAARNYLNTVQPTSLVGAATNSATSLEVASNTGFPTPPYTIAIDRGDPANEEVCLVTAHPDSTHMTVTRGYDGTTGVAHDAGVSVEHAVAAVDYADANDHIFDTGRDDHTQYLTTARHAAIDHSSIVGGYLPLGGIMGYAGSGDVGPNLLIADGRAISRTTYSGLFAVLSTQFGSGDGSTTFNIPDLRGRTMIGMDNPGTAQGAANRMTDSAADTRGGTGGTETVTLTTAQMPTHTHVQNSHTHVADAHSHTGTTDTDSHRHEAASGAEAFIVQVGSGGDVNFSLGGGTPVTKDQRQYTEFAAHDHTLNVNTTVVTIQSTTATNQNSGSGNSHRNDQPWIAINYLIRVL
jgi:microcystin-dependent protein